MGIERRINLVSGIYDSSEYIVEGVTDKKLKEVVRELTEQYLKGEEKKEMMVRYRSLGGWVPVIDQVRIEGKEVRISREYFEMIPLPSFRQSWDRFLEGRDCVYLVLRVNSGPARQIGVEETPEGTEIGRYAFCGEIELAADF